MQSARCVGGHVWVCVGGVCETNNVSHVMYVGVCGRMWGGVCEPNHMSCGMTEPSHGSAEIQWFTCVYMVQSEHTKPMCTAY